jgi:hypothetical protein
MAGNGKRASGKIAVKMLLLLKARRPQKHVWPDVTLSGRMYDKVLRVVFRPAIVKPTKAR